MSLLKYLSIFLLAAALVGCGHGYEGDYKVTVETPMGFGMSFVPEAKQATIGSDYIEVEGKRQTFDTVSVRNEGGQEYLVFKLKGDEEVFKIIDM